MFDSLDTHRSVIFPIKTMIYFFYLPFFEGNQTLSLINKSLIFINPIFLRKITEPWVSTQLMLI